MKENKRPSAEACP